MNDEAAGSGGSASAARHRSPSALVAFTACVHRTELDRAAEAKLVTRPHYPNAALDALVERGREHERAHLDDLRAQGLEVVEIPSVFADVHELAAAAGRTLEAMQRGVAVIYQAAFVQTDAGTTWRGHVDFLRRVDTHSNLGAWSYEPWDAKLAREAKASALLQLCVYAEMIERVQGAPVARVHLVLGGPERAMPSYRWASVAPYYRQVRRQFLARVGSSQPPVFPVTDPYPDPVEHCEVCSWSPVCEKRRKVDDHVSRVASISRAQRKALGQRDITTMTGLSKAIMPLTPPLKRAHVPAMTRVREQARVQREGEEAGRPVWELILGASDADAATPRRPEHQMGLAALPAPSPGDLFFDIEGDPFVGEGGHEYLFGVVTPEGYRSFWSFDAVGEQEMFEKVVDLFHDRLRLHPDLHVYHFAHYETTALKRLAGRLGTRVEEVDDLLRREIFVDLFRVVRQGIRASVESYSIKKLEAFYDFPRETELRIAGDAKATLELWLEAARPERLSNHAELCRVVESYNREDCVSAARLRDWLEARRSDLEAAVGHPVPRPTRTPPKPSEDTTELKARIAAVKARLTVDVPADPTERSPVQQGRWLLAQLVEWHVREDKSAWWDYFRMLYDLSDDDMVEERNGLGGITYVGSTGVVVKSSTLHRYRFIEQEHSLREGDSCDARKPGFRKADADAGDEKPRNVTIYAIDDVACTFDITVGNQKGGKSRPPPEIGALIPTTVVGTKHHRARLLELAEWTAEHGIDVPGPHQLARDLLLRVPPGASGPGGAASAPLVRDGEPAQVAAIRLSLELARAPRGASLAVQGPPGSGKTHTGAEMVLALVDAGFKVGVSGPSHKVIENLLAKICELGRKGDAGRTVAIGQKPAREGDPLNDPFVVRLDAEADVAAALQARDIQIAAGTPWMWAHPAMAGAVDVLLVDEAGQLSLANAVAIAHATRNFAFLGDPCQLTQPQKGVHPDGAEASVLEHLSPDKDTFTIPRHQGVFLDTTRRLHPDLCQFTSALFYDDRLSSTVLAERQLVIADGPLGGAGIRWWPIAHAGNQNESSEEVAAVQDLFACLLNGNVKWTDETGACRPLQVADIVVLAPYNAQVRALLAALPAGANVGTVDKFQGQEAAVSIYSMTTSTPEDAPRGMEFLYSLNRLNVATSRAKSVAIVVGSPALLSPVCKTPRQMMLAAGLCGVAERGAGG